jgi:hypothetical protein
MTPPAVCVTIPVALRAVPEGVPEFTAFTSLVDGKTYLYGPKQTLFSSSLTKRNKWTTSAQISR